MREIKILVPGSGEVGKSALTVHFVSGTFAEKYIPTLDDLYRKEFEVDGAPCVLEILDNDAKERLNSTRDLYVISGQGFMVVYSAKGLHTFQIVRKTNEQTIRKKGSERVPVILVGNRIESSDGLSQHQDVCVMKGKVSKSLTAKHLSHGNRFSNLPIFICPCLFVYLFLSDQFSRNSQLVDEEVTYRLDEISDADELVKVADIIYESLTKCLRMFIMTSFDMTRDMLITPKRIEYAKQKEQQLYVSLMEIANKKQEEIKNIITNTIASMRDELLEEAATCNIEFLACINSSGQQTELSALTNHHEHLIRALPLTATTNFTTTSTTITTRHELSDSSGDDINKCNISREVADCNQATSLPLNVLNSLLSSGHGTGSAHTSSCLLPSSYSDYSSCSSSSNEFNRRYSARDIQIAMTTIQDMVLGKLNVAIASRLISSVDCLRSSYIGTLERCLESLENLPYSNGVSTSLNSNSYYDGRNHDNIASNSLKQILNAAYQVEINMKTTSSLIRKIWEKMKQLVSTSFSSWRNQPLISVEWKRKVAAEVLDSISESHLARSICSQFKVRLRLSHEQFIAAMKELETIHSGRLEKTQQKRVKVRKYFAPRIARYALELTSLRDSVLNGMPDLRKEIGRGQYGVVYACDSWGGYSPVAIKSVVPPDEKHWNDLAMEFYYTRSIPEHDRIVQIRGSVIDYSYGGGATPAVLLIMDRLSRDLYSAIKNGLDWLGRLQVAIDVVQGIRFLHSQGLVHRDIKLKNVLLDKRNRAKITDLGFCKPGAMISGSIVGTPIHMAPELFTGNYDNSVDVYAFGILFWYICAGHVRLPYIFEQCQNKDQLWSCVRKGVRPERLPQFDEDCWAIMEACWAKEPSQRPLLGDIEPKLVAILEKYKIVNGMNFSKRQYKTRSHCLGHVERLAEI